MNATESKLANATAIETYGNVMLSKGLRDRAAWAFAEAKKIRDELAARPAYRALAA